MQVNIMHTSILTFPTRSVYRLRTNPTKIILTQNTLKSHLFHHIRPKTMRPPHKTTKTNSSTPSKTVFQCHKTKTQQISPPSTLSNFDD